MTIGLTELVVMLVGLLFYFLSLRHYPSLKPIGLIMFGVGLLLWLPHGAHALGLH
jgi:multisubunit Na+/H+ antiporter MnhB subunit